MSHCQRPPNILYRNHEGGGTFSDVTPDAGVGAESQDNRGVAWADFDGDLDLDVYVTNSNSINGALTNKRNLWKSNTPLKSSGKLNKCKNRNKGLWME